MRPPPISCGIDFGTTNSALAFATEDTTSLLHLEGNNTTIPSALFYNYQQHHFTYGRAAVLDYLDGHPGRFLRALKSVLGSSLMDETTQIGTKRHTFEEIIGFFVAHIKNRAESACGRPLETAVIGRPVFFVDDNPDADRQAQHQLESIARAQGINEISFEYEPLAAARDYESRITKEELVLVIDIGGGTSDFSLIRLSPTSRRRTDRNSDILANAGIHIAGIDFDRLFSMSTVMPHMGYQSPLKGGQLIMPAHPFVSLATWHLINMLYKSENVAEIHDLARESARPDLFNRFVEIIDNQRGHELAHTVEHTKITLAQQSSTLMNLNFIEHNWQIETTAETLEKAIASASDKIISKAVETVTHQARIRKEQVNSIFMTGGSTGLPGFKKRVQNSFPDTPIYSGDNFSSVASGLGLCALQRYG